MTRKTVIGLGEILWDVLPGSRTLGGAPANFAFHVTALGGTGIPISRLGDDALGREALSVLGANTVCTDMISVDPIHPTGTVNALIDANGVASYAFPDNVAWDHIVLNAAAHDLASRADAICFGTLAQRSPVSRKSIQDCLRSAPGALAVFDINLRQDFHTPSIIADSLGLADVLKVNDEELDALTAMFSLPSNEEAALRRLMDRHDLQLCVLTRGGRGSLIMSPTASSELPGASVDMIDTIGAGDAFTAAMTLAYLEGWELDRLHRRAARVAAFVCGQPGAMPEIPDHLRIN